MDAFETWNLGDIVTIPPRGPLTLRAKYRVPSRESSGFMILGECETAVVREDETLWVLLPVTGFPESLRLGRPLAEGACTFWSPHLPALSGFMGQVLWRLVRPRGGVAPALVTWRGPLRLSLMPVHKVDAERVSALRMPVPANVGGEVPVRVSAEVIPSPVTVPSLARH